MNELKPEQWFDLRLQEADINEQLDGMHQLLLDKRRELQDYYEEKKAKFAQGDDLAPGC